MAAVGLAAPFANQLLAIGGVVLFVGTKRQAQETVHDEAVRCGMPYVTERWLGGMLTNWKTMYQRIQELERMEKLVSSGEVERLTKKEGLLIQREINRLNIRLSGVRSITRVPDMVFIVDVMREESAVHEANLLKIPVVALVDTNCDPSRVDYVIPSNDDAIRAIKLLVAKMADAVLEGKAMRKEDESAEETPAAVEKSADARPSKSRKGQHVVEAADVDEVGEGDLLGESTLAKLNVARKPEEKPEVVAVQPEVVETPEVAAIQPEPALSEVEVIKDEAGAADESAPAA